MSCRLLEPMNWADTPKSSSGNARWSENDFQGSGNGLKYKSPEVAERKHSKRMNPVRSSKIVSLTGISALTCVRSCLIVDLFGPVHDLCTAQLKQL